MVDLLSIILTFFSIFAIAYVVKLYLENKGSSHKLPHGSMGWWPFLGETLNFLKPHESNSLGSFLQERCSRYGRVFKSHLFGYPTIVSCDFELNMFILQNEGKLFPVDYPKVMHKILGKFSLLLNKGELHKKLRSTVISFVSASKCESNFIHSVEMLVLSRINSWGSNCTQVAFYKEAKRFSINVMLKHLLNINPDEPIASKILENFENYIKGFISLPINIPGTTYFKAVKARIRLSSIIKDIIIERRSKVDNVVEGRDLLNLILSKQNLCDEERIGIVLDLLFGGYETTSKLLSLIVYFLDGAPNALQTLKEDNSTSQKVAPFGGGPRFCPGADLAKVEIAFFLHHLVLNYRGHRRRCTHFFTCVSARSSWQVAGLSSIIVYVAFQQGSATDRVFILCQNEVYATVDRVATLFWIIWNTRNDKILNDNARMPSQVRRVAFGPWNECFATHKMNSIDDHYVSLLSTNRWKKKSRIKWLKCNVDATCFVDSEGQQWVLVSVIALVSLLSHSGSGNGGG
ncbi:unnamed protein product [Trifolium pratense]|uniref:Uncharacterized protein n=1 Tax=Trifolium pratense TaxID=57577 RepID=A0ACB0LMT4_TRIPR|nr:unnamed protein product [Trifolium pratense]